MPDADPPTSRSRWMRCIINRAAAKRLAALAVGALIVAFACYVTMLRMPGQSYRGPVPPPTTARAALEGHLRYDVEMLADRIGERTMFTRDDTLEQAANWLDAELTAMGYAVTRESYDLRDRKPANVIAERAGTDPALAPLIIGAHYDSFMGTPGANDNASGVAATLALARHVADARPRRTLRFALFVNEEPPFFQTPDMGSLVYARRLQERGESVYGMISIETIGWYSDQPGSQAYPPPLSMAYPSTGDFIGFVSNIKSRHLLRDVIGSFRTHANLPSEGGALPGSIAGVGWSDHWAFWQAGYPGIMITDTAPFRYPHYHKPTDTPDKLDYTRMALLVEALQHVIDDLADVTR